MSTILISDNLFAPEGSDIRYSAWTSSRPSVESYEHIILDLYFGSPDIDGYVQLSDAFNNVHFYELGSEVAKSLKAGGVVTALIGPIAYTNRNLFDYYNEEVLLERSYP